MRRRGASLCLCLTVAMIAGAPAGAAPSANLASCQKAMLGHGSASWRSASAVAGPAGVRKRPLRQMQRTANGMVAKMPMLIEGRAPETVTVSVPPQLRRRVFLYYGNVIGRDGRPTTSFHEARGNSETTFELCPHRPRTAWPGGIRVKGRAPVHLLVQTEDRARPYRLNLGRPQPDR